MKESNINLTDGRLLASNTMLNLLGQLLPMALAVLAIPPLVHGLGCARFVLVSADASAGRLGRSDNTGHFAHAGSHWTQDPCAAPGRSSTEFLSAGIVYSCSYHYLRPARHPGGATAFPGTQPYSHSHEHFFLCRPVAGTSFFP